VRAESKDNANSTVRNSDQALAIWTEIIHVVEKAFVSLPGISLSFSSNQYD